MLESEPKRLNSSKRMLKAKGGVVDEVAVVVGEAVTDLLQVLVFS